MAITPPTIGQNPYGPTLLAALATLDGYPRSALVMPYIVGRYYSTSMQAPATTPNGVTHATGQIHFVPFWASYQLKIGNMKASIASASATTGSKYRLGIYAPHATTMMPDTLLVDTGEIAADVATDAITAVGPITVPAQSLIWLAYTHGAASAPGIRSTSLNTNVFGSDIGQNSGNLVQTGFTFGPLPATTTPANLTTNASLPPMITVRAVA